MNSFYEVWTELVNHRSEKILSDFDGNSLSLGDLNTCLCSLASWISKLKTPDESVKRILTILLAAGAQPNESGRLADKRWPLEKIVVDSKDPNVVLPFIEELKKWGALPKGHNGKSLIALTNNLDMALIVTKAYSSKRLASLAKKKFGPVFLARTESQTFEDLIKNSSKPRGKRI